MVFNIRILNNLDRESNNIVIKSERKLKDILINEKLIDFPCGGKGTCGKCKVKIKESLPYTEEELKNLSEEEVKNNIHLACKVLVDRDLTLIMEEKGEFSILTSTNIDNVELDSGIEIIDISDIAKEMGNSVKSNIDILREYLKKTNKNVNNINNIKFIKKLKLINDESNRNMNLIVFNNQAIDIVLGKAESYGIAVDIGTTTVAMYVYDLITGRFIDSISSINPQRVFGYDVISRISYADSREKLEKLQEVIIEKLSYMIEKLFNKHNLKTEYLNHAVIVGNTTMSHLLIGADISNFGRAPFTPQFLEKICFDAIDVGIDKLSNCTISLVNNMSSFVGGDLVAGIIDTELDNSDQYNMLIDIGTNGEIIIGNREKIYCCATAAGPAFEAANISCGVGSVEGAICKVYKEDGKLKYKTIGEAPPTGICGTGLIDLIAYLLDEEIIDEYGFLEEDFIVAKDINGKEISITPKDIREVQLAKAAIAAGIECLIEEVGTNLEKLNKIFVAGGFGNYIDIDSAIKIGLIPKAKEKIKCVGNSAGSGACKILLTRKLTDKCDNVCRKAGYIELSSSKLFMEKYIDNMYFGEYE